MKKEPGAGVSARRAELLRLAAEMFAERGFRATTVRDIADAAGILSGSLYHHFDSKESMVDEILTGFLGELFGRYRQIVESGMPPKATLEAIVVASLESIDKQHAAVAIYQNDAKHLATFDRFGYIAERGVEFRKIWVGVLEEGVRAGAFRPDLDVELVYRFIRDTVWVAVHWYRPGGQLSAQDVAEQYLGILLDGISTRRRPVKAPARRP
ncbi:TetR/AcrR family transcriptional regulator [Actinosynnema sp. ALI-1.44]|uniref:TetR/AcrR family transcriptional regulator n=1 Tax=Actinosynnema sp. ALI-1.44 TaxID=1933779 RepID=UPI0022A9AC70|nr:TetR/AcrR family transcriptional regulator [Actinosynnema sp. ALI-1.44]